MRVTKRRRTGRHAEPGPSQKHTNVTCQVTTNYTPAGKYLGTCPVCGSEGKLDVTSRPSGGYWIGCFSCEAEGLTGGDLLREIAACVNAPGGGAIKDDPLHWLGDYLDTQTATDREPDQLPSPASITRRHERLLSTRNALDYLLGERGLTLGTLRRAAVGWESDPPAFTFPIYDARGQLVNVIRRPSDAPPGEKYRGMFGRNKDHGGVQLYPHPLPHGSWLLVEGLLDALLGRQHGLPTVTSTHGITFLDAWLPLVKGRRVACMYDVGAEQAMYRRVEALREAGADAWPVRLAWLLSSGKDTTDYFTAGGTTQRLIRHIKHERRRAAS
jgi:hypothetical protein